MAFTRMIGFIAAQGKGKTQTMVNRLNANKTKSCIAYFSENTIEELEVHYGLTKRENLKVVANATSNITLKEILNTCSKKKSTYIFIDYLQNIVNEKNQFIGKNEVQSVNDINKLLALAYKNDLYFWINLQATKSGREFRGSGRVLDKLHTLISQDIETNVCTLIKDRFRENEYMLYILNKERETKETKKGSSKVDDNEDTLNKISYFYDQNE